MFYEFTSIKICISQMSILKKMMKDWRWFRQVMASKKSSNKIKNSILYSQNTFTNSFCLVLFIITSSTIFDL